ncbi:MAG: type II CAAX endopeptidase family protein [Candidatus Bathyarchaeia archaeon]
MFATKPLPKKLYLVGVAVIFIAVYSQYLIRYGSITGYIVVYGIPILVVSLLFGKQILRQAGKNNKDAAKYGLGLFGVLTVIGLFLAVIALLIIMRFDPHAVNLLNKPNPVLNVSSKVAWLMIPVSIFVIGPAEEYLFRGFIYGGLLSISKGRYWIPLAVLSSVMFASVHAYYAVTYGVASALPFIEIITFGLAMSITYYWSSGNILVLALIHGTFDATAFLGVATTTQIGVTAELLMIFVGIGFAAVFLLKKITIPPPPNPPAPPKTPPPPDPPQISRTFRT